MRIMRIMRLQGHFADTDSGVSLCGTKVKRQGKLRWYQRGYCVTCSERLLRDYNDAVADLDRLVPLGRDQARALDRVTDLWREMAQALGQPHPAPRPTLEWAPEVKSQPSNHASGTAIDLNATFHCGPWTMEDGVVRDSNGYAPDLSKTGTLYHPAYCADDEYDDLEVDLDTDEIVGDVRPLRKVHRAVVRGMVDGVPVEFDVTDQLQAQIKGVSEDTVRRMGQDVYDEEEQVTPPTVQLVTCDVQMSGEGVEYCYADVTIVGSRDVEYSLDLTQRMQQFLKERGRATHEDLKNLAQDEFNEQWVAER